MPDAGAVRIDKWLWAARFFKTRTLASTAVARGRVQVNGDPAKPARALRAGDILDIARERDQIQVIVMNLSTRRGPAEEAATLYHETQESIERRARDQAARAVMPARAPAPPRRPDKKARRELQRLLRGD